MSGFLKELLRRNRLLAIVGGIHFGLLAVSLILLLVDDRVVTGVNVWIKPAKFMASIGIYLWTLAWLCEYVRSGTWTTGLVSGVASLAMIGETVGLWTQAIRGTTSHFNNSTPFDGAIFGMMGILILLNSLAIAYFLVLFFIVNKDLDPVVLWGIRLGLLVFLIGSGQGMLMIERSAHAVGVPDGGPGLPFLNWSTEGGDLRVAHALGLHALQLIPLVGWLLSSRRKLFGSLSKTVGIALVVTFSGAYVALFTLLLNQALAGRPLISL